MPITIASIMNLMGPDGMKAKAIVAGAAIAGLMSGAFVATFPRGSFNRETRRFASGRKKGERQTLL